MCSAVVAQAAIKSTLVDYTVDGKEYQGFLSVNEQQKGPRPAVLVVPEWWGLNDYAKRRARELASLGYIAFVADMYGKGVVAKTPEEAGTLAGAFYQDREKFTLMATAAYEQMLMQADVDTARTAAIGFCFGGTAALYLARSGADILGTVSFHGNLSNPTPEIAKNIKGRVLVLHGAADPFAPAEQVAGLEKEFKDAGVNYKLILYPDAVHAFTNPAAGDDPSKGAAYNAEAEKAAMEEMRVFLSELFSEKKE